MVDIIQSVYLKLSGLSFHFLVELLLLSMLCHRPTPDPPELLILVLLLPLLLEVVLPTLPQDVLDILVAVDETAPPILSI